jgi:small acid-soluble spore protein D (minor alpha/beta-type SASP)
MIKHIISDTKKATLSCRRILEKKEMSFMARSSNKLLVPGIEQALDSIKYEIAQEFGVNLGSDTVSRANGSVGGEITKRLVQTAQSQLNGQFNPEQ